MTSDDGRLSSSPFPHPSSLLRLPLPFSERRWLLLGLDLLMMNAGLALALSLRPDIRLSGSGFLDRPLWFIFPSLLWLPLAWVFDVYDLRVAGRFSTAAPAILKAGLFTAVLYLLIPYITPPLPPSRSQLFAFPLILLAGLILGRGLYGLVLSQPAFCRRVLIVGAGWAGRTIAEVLAGDGNGAYEVVGFVDDDPEKQGTVLEVAGRRLPVLGDRHVLRDLVSRQRADALVLAITRDIDAHMLQVLTDCLETGVEVIPMLVLYEQLTGRVPIEHVGDNWYVAMPLQHPGTGTLWPLVNRLFDIFSASLGLLFLALAFPFIAAAIYLDSPGPIFYKQERVGKGGRRFWVYKFRSMVPDAEKGQAVWAQENDSRVTRVGRLLRKTHVDEFPQFINILKGEMSAVGPRPERPEFVEKLAHKIPFYRVRHAVKPGMAGWGLVKQGYSSSEEDAIIKLQYDLYYIKHQSLWLDIVILLKTIVDTLTLRGR